MAGAVEDDIVIACIRTVVVKACGTAAILVTFTGRRILDLVGLVLNVAAICTIVRAYPTLHLLWTYRNWEEEKWGPWVWRFGGLLQILIFLVDIPFAVMLFFVTVFFWRLAIMIHDKDEDWYDKYNFRDFGYIGCTIRIDIFISFLGLLTDFLVIPFAVIVFCSWRSKRAYDMLRVDRSRSGRVAHRDLNRKFVILQQFLLVLLDLCVIIMFLLLCITWRLSVMIGLVQQALEEYSKVNPEDTTPPLNTRTIQNQLNGVEWNFRRRVFYNFLRLLLDLLMVPTLLLLLFSWRAPILVKKLRNFKEDLKSRQESRWRTEMRLRGGVLTHFGRYCFDLAMLVPILIVLCSWRSPILILKFQRFFKSKMKRADELKLRKSILFHTGQVFIDLISIPPMLITLLSWRLLFFVHIFPLNANKSAARKFKKVRIQFWWEMLYFFLDLPVIAAFCLIVCFCWCYPWRLLQILEEFTRMRKRSYRSNWWGDNFQCEMRRTILAETGCLLCDIISTVFGLIVLVTGWRVPFLINKIRKVRGEYRNRPNSRHSFFRIHHAIFKQFGLLFLDLLMLVFIVIIFGTLWRIKPMVRKIMKHSKYEDPNEKSESDDDDDDEGGEGEAPRPLSAVVLELPAAAELDVLVGDVATTPEQGPVTETTAVELTEGGNVAPPPQDDQEQGQEQEQEQKQKEQQEQEQKEQKEDSPQPGKYQPSFSDILFGVRGWKIRKAICLNIFGLLLDIPAFIMLVINCAFIYQIPFILQRFLECGDFYQEFFFITLDETNHLLQDIAFFFLFLVLTLVRPVAVWINMLEDSDHLKMKKTKEYLVKLQHVVKKRRKVQQNLDSALSVFVKYYQLYAANPNSVTKRFIEEVQVFTDEIKELRDKMLERELDDRLIYILANVYFYESKRPYLFTRRYKLEEMYCQKACVAARGRNLKMWNEEMKVIDDKLDDLYVQIENFKVKKTPLWSEKNGFLLRTRKQNQRVIINTITSGYFGTIAVFLLNCILIYRVPIMIKSMLQVSYCRFRVRDAALEQTKQYALDCLAMLKVLIVVLSIYRCPALLSDLAHDLLSKQSLSAARKTVDKYPVNILKDLVDLICLVLRWDTVVFIFASTLFVILIPLSVIINTVQATNMNIILVFILSLPVYAVIMSGPFIIVHKVSDIVMSNATIDNSIISLYIAGFLAFITLIMALFVVVKTKIQEADNRRVRSIDYIRFNWFNAQVIFLEVLELLQLLALVFSIRNLALPYLV